MFVVKIPHFVFYYHI